MTFSLALTIVRGMAGEIPGLVRRYAEYRYFDGILSFLARDGIRYQESSRRLEDESVHIARELGLQPVSYIPSNLIDGDVRWVIYFYIINAATGVAQGSPPKYAAGSAGSTGSLEGADFSSRGSVQK